MNNWKETTLGKLGTVITGKTPSTKREDYFGSFVPFVTPKDMNGRKIISSTERYLTQAGVEAVKSSLLPANAVMVSCIGSDMGKVAIAGRECVTNQQINSIIVNEAVCPDYVYYDLSHRQVEIKSKSSGSAVPILNKGHFEQLQIELPPLPEQKAIAHILGTLDDKIELNLRMNQTLEEIAGAIFKSWFVDFEFPNSEGKPYKSSGGEMIDSETGKIPKGWRIGNLPDVFEINPTRTLKKGESAPYLDMKGMPTQGHRAEGWYYREFTSGSRFANGDTLIARITPCLENGKTAFVDFLPDKEVGWGSTEFIVLRPKMPLPPYYGYLFARDENFRSFAISQMTGSSGRQRVPEDSFSNFSVVVPSDDVATKFGNVVNPFALRAKLNSEESRTFAALRDTLLPKLLSSEIRIKDAEEFLKERGL